MSPLILIDDSVWVGDVYTVCLQDVLQMEVQFLLHDRQSVDELIRQTLEMDPDYLLLDAQLADDAFGPHVLLQMRSVRPQVRCIGFSSDSGYKSQFLDAGAVGFVHKRRDHPWESAREVAGIVAKLQKERGE